LLYGAGVRLSEALRLRVKDIDFQTRQITVRDGKGAKDRATMLPDSLQEPLKKTSGACKIYSHGRFTARFGRSLAATRFEQKISERRARVKWQYVFPSTKISLTREDGKTKTAPHIGNDDTKSRQKGSG
jgi:integrase